MLCLIVLAGLAGIRSGFADATPDEVFILTVRVFADTIGVGLACPGCNGIFESGDGKGMPVPPAEIVVQDGVTGDEVVRGWTRSVAGAGYVSFVLERGRRYRVVLAEEPAGFELCPNSRRERELDAGGYGEDHAFVSYALWRGCPVGVVPATPTPRASATPTPTLTPTASATPSPTPTPTPS
ncbi:MAG: hypothetical protein D6791_06975, partial [Chloroflexi bacterium]